MYVIYCHTRKDGVAALDGHTFLFGGKALSVSALKEGTPERIAYDGVVFAINGGSMMITSAGHVIPTPSEAQARRWTGFQPWEASFVSCVYMTSALSHDESKEHTLFSVWKQR
jgi:hypothetical protein